MFSPEKEKRSWSLFRMAFRLFPRFMTKTLYKELSTNPPPRFSQKELADIKRMTFSQASG